MSDRVAEIYDFIVCGLKAGRDKEPILLDALDRWPDISAGEWERVTIKLEALDRQLAALVSEAAGRA